MNKQDKNTRLLKGGLSQHMKPSDCFHLGFCCFLSASQCDTGRLLRRKTTWKSDKICTNHSGITTYKLQKKYIIYFLHWVQGLHCQRSQFLKRNWVQRELKIWKSDFFKTNSGIQCQVLIKCYFSAEVVAYFSKQTLIVKLNMQKTTTWCVVYSLLRESR